MQLISYTAAIRCIQAFDLQWEAMNTGFDVFMDKHNSYVHQSVLLYSLILVIPWGVFSFSLLKAFLQNHFKTGVVLTVV